LEICALLSKPSRRQVDLEVKYVGFEVPDEFVVGYGIDYAGAYRNLPDICVLKPEVFAKDFLSTKTGDAPVATLRGSVTGNPSP
jgi:hypothetical protein